MFTRKLYHFKKDGILSRSTGCQKYAKGGTQELCDVVSLAEKAVGGATFTPRCLQDELAGTAVDLKKLVKRNPVLKSAISKFTNTKSELQHGLIILLVSKAAGFDTKDFTKNQYDAGILHSQRTLAKSLDMLFTGHRIHKAIVNLQEKEKIGDQQLLSGNKIVLLSGDILLARILLNIGGLCNNEVLELVSRIQRDKVEAEFLGEHGADDQPIPSKPKVGHEIRPYDWENEYKLEKLEGNSYLGQGKEEWVLRTMLQSGSILSKGCQGAMKLAHRYDMERDAYILGGHLALIWQLYLDIKDFFTNRSFSLVSAPVIMALWEYPSLYDHLKSSKSPVDLNDLSYAVRSTRCMDILFSSLGDELASVVKHSERLPVDDARLALQNIAWTVHGEAVKILEQEIKNCN